MFPNDIAPMFFVFLPILVSVTGASVGFIMLLWSVPDKPGNQTHEGAKYIGTLFIVLGFLALPFACYLSYGLYGWTW